MNLRELRLSKNLKLRQVAAEINCDPGQLSRVERGGNLTMALAVRLAQRYGAPLDEIAACAGLLKH